MRKEPKGQSMLSEIEEKMVTRAGYFQNCLTERTVRFPRAQEVRTLLPRIFYYYQVEPLINSGRIDIDYDRFISSVRRCTLEAYEWAIQEAMTRYGVDTNRFLTNLDILLHGEEEELPEVLTRPGNEFFRQWLQQFEVEEVYYPVLEEFSCYGLLPNCLLEELNCWKESRALSSQELEIEV